MTAVNAPLSSIGVGNMYRGNVVPYVVPMPVSKISLVTNFSRPAKGLHGTQGKYVYVRLVHMLV